MTMTSLEPVLLRLAVHGDARAISELVVALTKRWIAPDCTEDGTARLLESMATAQVERRLGAGHLHVVAEYEGRIVGVAALRLPSHLYYLFVADDMQRRGLARRLWNLARAGAAPDAPITVNASLHAVEVYRRLGFEPAGAMRFEHGIRAQPMCWLPADADPARLR